jgi:uncharacterized heparinase superfamily protein
VIRRAAARARRILRKPPREIARRLAAEAVVRSERVLGPRRARQLDRATLLRELRAESPDLLWSRLRERLYLPGAALDPASLAAAFPEEPVRVAAGAGAALEHRVDMLGSGPTTLPDPIDWHADIKTGRRWPPAYARSIAYVDLADASDVKLPWELSRLQWLIPLGQAYLLDGDDRYAAESARILDDWIAANPYGGSVNWAVTMEPSLRILVLTWMFHVFAASEAWSDHDFRLRFLRALFLHGDFVARNLERSDVNGNHYTANAAGLVLAGLFFDEGSRPTAWAEQGWQILLEELPRQVTPDGVDFEASIAYHRLVTELFLLPALYRDRLGLDVPRWYWDRLALMARFSFAATRPDGTTPLIGDHDDARALPLGSQSLGDHRYLAGVLAAWGEDQLRDAVAGPQSEAAWLLGADAVASLPEHPPVAAGSAAFADAGFYVMRGPQTHVFVDAGPVGLAGRGGHGHNDCLSFEAWLDGVLLVTDSGCYVYTASAEWRNLMRATAAHNTPMVDGAEQNRLDPRSLWTLEYDAVPEVRRWESGPRSDLLVASHAGYRRLPEPVTPVRSIAVDHELSLLVVADAFEGRGDHKLQVPFHLAPNVRAEEERTGRWSLDADGLTFVLEFSDSAAWQATLRRSHVAPSYGVLIESSCLELSRNGPLEPLVVAIAPSRIGDPLLRAEQLLAARD